MFTIIGGDGREYGPVTAEQVRSWIAGGRANRDTKIKAAGTDTWKTIADFPELTDGAQAGGFAASAPVAAAPAGTPSKLDIISCYERSWALLKANFWALFGVSFMMALIYACLGYSHFWGLFFVSPILGGVFAAGHYYYFLLKIRGQPASLGDAFAGFTKAFFTLLVAALVAWVFIIVGLFCLIVPGVYLAFAYAFTYILAVDKGLGFWEAMETSRRTITPQWWRVFGLILLGIPFFLLGLAALGVGVFIALPLIVGAFAYGYEDLCNPKK
jgi:hypothetical protein